MIVSEEQAREKWCPFASVPNLLKGVAGNRQDAGLGGEPGIPSAARCVASSCMAWRKTETRDVYGKPMHFGYCGLAGKPVE